jgi:hypothetical protein
MATAVRTLMAGAVKKPHLIRSNSSSTRERSKSVTRAAVLEQTRKWLPLAAISSLSMCSVPPPASVLIIARLTPHE